MALLDSGLKQRMVGALVLLALAVIFLPMLFNREQEARRVLVDAPEMPQMPAVPPVRQEQVSVPEPQLPAEAAQPVESVSAPIASSSSTDASVPAAVRNAENAPIQSAQVAVPPAESRLDNNRLPVSWSVQLASLSSRDNALKLQKTLRSQGYNAYVRQAGDMNRVLVGPVIERDEANRLRDQLNRQHKLKGFIVRFEPERE